MNRTLKAVLLTATTALTAAAITGGASASVLATVADSYTVDTAWANVTNTSGFWESNVTVNGVNAGTLAPGASVNINIGDIDDYCAGCNIPASVQIGSQTFSAIFPYDNAVFNDNYGATGFLGNITGNVPEPATMAIVGTALLGAAGLRRRRRKNV